jgi:RND family efflux transporter MFP subunit
MKSFLQFVLGRPSTVTAVAAVLAAVLLIALALYGLWTIIVKNREPARSLLKLLVPLLVLGSAGLFTYYLLTTKVTAVRTPMKEHPLAVEVQMARRESIRPTVTGMGSVLAARTVVLQPQVSGRITEQSPNLVPGGYLKAEEVVARIDPRDYELSVQQEEANVLQCSADLELEQGQQAIAAREWELLGPEVSRQEAARDLALRKPQLAIARARLSAARSRLELAELNLDRTIIRAPFNALVLSESTELGQLVTPATGLATLIGTDRFWVQVSVPIERLGLIAVPGPSGQEGAAARLIQVTGQGGNTAWEGRVVRLLGDLEPRSRLARLLVEVHDPLGLEAATPAPLLVGSYVRAEIAGREPLDVIPVPRVALHEGDRVCIMTREKRLTIRDVEIAWSTPDTVYVSSGIKGTERIVTSLISAPVRGMKLRVAGQDENDGAAAEPAGQRP